VEITVSNGFAICLDPIEDVPPEEIFQEDNIFLAQKARTTNKSDNTT
jgi:hypothetical protein